MVMTTRKQHTLYRTNRTKYARRYAENPRAGFLPHTGKLHHLVRINCHQLIPIVCFYFRRLNLLSTHV
jgi:acetyl/propionyl-CoA carboxylase alpha subunit